MTKQIKTLSNDQVLKLWDAHLSSRAIPNYMEFAREVGQEITLLHAGDSAELETYRRVLAGLPDGAIDGGWTAAGICAYAKRLEEQVKLQPADQGEMGSESWAELYRLREEVKGPDGYVAWKDAAVAERLRRVSAVAEFKNLHRALCERFGYYHDELDWRRDQVSLIEHIAKLCAAPQEDKDSRRYKWLRNDDAQYIATVRIYQHIIGSWSSLTQDELDNAIDVAMQAEQTGGSE